jgi:hypothetical protein
MNAVSVLDEVLAGMRDRSSGPTPILRGRTVGNALADMIKGARSDLATDHETC